MNHLLSALLRIAPDLPVSEIALSAGQPVQEIRAAIPNLIFPTTAAVCAVIPLDNGGQREAGLVGCEGVIGVEGFWVHDTCSAARWLVQISGRAAVVRVDRARASLARLAAAQHHLHVFHQAFVGQVMQIAACNATHSAEARVARWLLLCVDRVPGIEVSLTHQSIADILGISRPRVTLIAQAMQASGLIRYNRGVVTVVDQVGLARAACECYAVIRQFYEALLPYRPDCDHEAFLSTSAAGSV
ncbi:MAG TPA: Crp/Fnr family transcriptional regulator [Burkholderiales bacterium]|nr:Crp/Fnr family transcriptional regulator [Burkholderiales bacterium]